MKIFFFNEKNRFKLTSNSFICFSLQEDNDKIIDFSPPKVLIFPLPVVNIILFLLHMKYTKTVHAWGKLSNVIDIDGCLLCQKSLVLLFS